MKTYEYNDAIEILIGLLAVQDKMLLARELGKLMVMYTSKHSSGWNIKSLDLSIRAPEDGNFVIKIGNQE